MHDTNLPKPPKAFPDLATCRVKPAGFADYFDCLSAWAGYCPHALRFGSGHYCRHTTARDIFARKDKPA